jgi:RNA polymerase sigma factor (sigma-70 family)
MTTSTAVLAHTTSATARDEFERVADARGPALLGLAMAILRNRTDAEDAYQSAMEHAWRGWGTLQDEGSRASWLATICVRTALRHRRQRIRWHWTHASADHSAGLVELIPDDPDMARALDRLSPRQRAVVALHFGHGYTLDETAAIVGCRGGTARSHLARALETLRKELSHERSHP